MIFETPTPQPSQTGGDVIDFDVACIKCGYNLRTLHAGGVCPECEHRILSSIDEHLRRRVSKFELARMKDRPLKSVRSIRTGAFYAILANVLILSVTHLPQWMFKRKTPWRTAMLVLVCIALASAAMSIWRFAVKARADRKIGVWPKILRFGSFGAVAYPIFATISNDYPTYDLRLLHQDVRYLVAPAAWLLGIGLSLRLIYAQWWLRLEGWWLLGWPLLACLVPLAFFYFVIAPCGIQTFYRGNFVSLDFFLEVPLATGSWPMAFREFERYLSPDYYYRYGGPEFLMALAVIAGHALVIAGDVALTWITTREIRRRSRAPSATNKIEFASTSGAQSSPDSVDPRA